MSLFPLSTLPTAHTKGLGVGGSVEWPVQAELRRGALNDYTMIYLPANNVQILNVYFYHTFVTVVGVCASVCDCVCDCVSDCVCVCVAEGAEPRWARCFSRLVSHRRL